MRVARPRHCGVGAGQDRGRQSAGACCLRLAHHQTTWLDDLAGRFQGCATTDALVRLRTGIRRLNESHGGVNSTTNGYHETITAAYVQLLAVSRPSRN